MARQQKLDNLWYKSDRALYKGGELSEQCRATEKALRSSTLLVSRLTEILEESFVKTYAVEEDFSDPAWERKTIAAAAERKVLRRIIRLLP